MKWWIRVFRPRDVEQQTEEVLSEIRYALQQLDIVLAKREHEQKEHPDGG